MESNEEPKSKICPFYVKTLMLECINIMLILKYGGVVLSFFI